MKTQSEAHNLLIDLKTQYSKSANIPQVDP